MFGWPGPASLQEKQQAFKAEKAVQTGQAKQSKPNRTMSKTMLKNNALGANFD